MATELAKPKETLPTEYAQFANMFSKEATEHVPLSQPYDHQINLDEAFIPKIGKFYLLSPRSEKLWKLSLMKILNQEKFVLPIPLKCPLSSSSKRQPCQDYCYLNEHII
jgi:hypothetical protein